MRGNRHPRARIERSGPDYTPPPADATASADEEMRRVLAREGLRLTEAIRFAKTIGDDVLPEGAAITEFPCPLGAECDALITVARAADTTSGVYVFNRCTDPLHWFAMVGLLRFAVLEASA